MEKILKNDMVFVRTGNDMGKKGKVLKVDPAAERIIVEGVNFIKRHTKPNPQAQVQGGIVEKEAPIRASNVLVVCDKCNAPTRIGVKKLENGSRTRICRKCGEVIERKQ